jgi:RNA polymerase sigma factor (sigma-70 family)
MTTEEFQQQAEKRRQQLVSIAHKYLGNTDEAEDIAQDAMVKLWLMREQLTLPIAGMASIVTRNLCIDALRKKHQTVDIAQLPDEADFSDDGEQIEQMLKVIDSLPSTQRTILRMRHLQGMEMREIALVLGSTEVAVRKTLSRARKVVRNRLIALLAAACVVVAISMTAVHFVKLETNEECVAYVYGKKYTDQQTVMAEMKQSLGNLADDDTQDEIEQQLNDLFRN